MNETVRRIIGPTILLFGGTYFDFEAPETSAFTIEDIAHGLSMVCRFAGQCIRHYSVAQHSVHISNNVPPEHAYQGLMHDAAEFQRFYVTTPLPPTIKEADIVMLATEQSQLMRNRDDWDYTRGRSPFAFEIPTWTPEEAKSQFLARFYQLRGIS